jgi:acetyl esterase/lipase
MPDTLARRSPRRAAALVAAVAALLAVATPAQTRFGAVRPAVERDVAFAVRDGADLKLDVYRPARRARVPIVVVFHGGGWSLGGRALGEAPLFAERLADAGYVAVSASYRLAPKAVWPAQGDDVRRAVQFVRGKAKEFGGDPDRIAALGASAGGHLAAFLATADDVADPRASDPVARQSSRVRCAVSICGPMDFTVTEGASGWAESTVLRLLTGSGRRSDPQVREIANRKIPDASPALLADPHDAPVFLAYGTRDTLVPLNQTTAMESALKRHGVPCEIFAVEKGGHCDFLGPLGDPAVAKKTPYWSRALAFLNRHLAETPASRPAADSRPAPSAK